MLLSQEHYGKKLYVENIRSWLPYLTTTVTSYDLLAFKVCFGDNFQL